MTDYETPKSTSHYNQQFYFETPKPAKAKASARAKLALKKVNLSGAAAGIAIGALVGGGHGLLGDKRGSGTVLPPFDLGPADLIPKSSAEAVVEKLTAILRVADALDRRRIKAVRSLLDLSPDFLAIAKASTSWI